MIFLDLETTGIDVVEKIPKLDINNKTVWENGKPAYKDERIFNKIISISWSFDDGVINCISSEDEIKMITKFYQLVELERINNKEVIVCGFSIDFDINFLRVRSLVNNIKIDDNFKILDLRLCINPNFTSPGKQSDYCKMLNIPVETENGSMIKKYYEEKNWDKIGAHNYEDVKNVKILYSKLDELGFLNKWRKQNEF